jgi:hypothetical protein
MRFTSKFAKSVAFSLAIVSATAAAAQMSMQVVPMQANEPRAQKAVALAELLTRADFPKAVEYVKANAASGSAAATAAEEQIKAVQSQFASGGFKVERVDRGMGADVLVMSTKEGADPAVVVVEVEPSDPYRIVAVRSFQGGFRRAPGA